MKPIDIRKQAGRPRLWVAAKAGVSEPTVKLYEVDVNAVTPPKKAALDPVYAELYAGLGRVG